jgi:threonyl-tRNA synthetase
MVNIRYRDDPSTQDRGTPVPLDEAIEKLNKLKKDYGRYNPFQHAKPAADGEKKADDAKTEAKA